MNLCLVYCHKGLTPHQFDNDIPIIEKLKKTGQLPIYRLRLDPMIDRAAKIVRSMGSKMTISDLNTHLLCYGFDHR